MELAVSSWQRNVPDVNQIKRQLGVKSAHVAKKTSLILAECSHDVRECKLFSNWISKVFAFLFNSDRSACISYIKEQGEQAFAEEMTKRKCQIIRRK